MRLTTSSIALCVACAAASPVEVTRGMKIALDKRTNLTGQDGIPNATALQQHVARSTAKILRGFATFQNNTGRPHPLARYNHTNDHWKRDGAGSESLIADQGGQMWQGCIQLGTPPQNLTIDFDTGSSDLVVPGPVCVANCNGHHEYHPEDSSTSATTYRGFELDYGDGSSAQGNEYKDVISIAGIQAQNVTVNTAVIYSGGFAPQNFNPDGLLGMGFPEIAEYNNPTVFQLMVEQSQVKDPVFSFKLSKQGGSELMLGGINVDLYKGNMVYTPVTEQGYWQVQMNSVIVNGNQTLGSMSAIIDTGTTLVIGDPSNVENFYAAIPGSKSLSSTYGPGFYSIPCNTTSTVSLEFGGKAFNISQELFVMGPTSEGSSDCLAGIVGQSKQGFWIVGDIFLENVYTVFDVGNKQVGFADLA